MFYLTDNFPIKKLVQTLLTSVFFHFETIHISKHTELKGKTSYYSIILTGKTELIKNSRIFFLNPNVSCLVPTMEDSGKKRDKE